MIRQFLTLFALVATMMVAGTNAFVSQKHGFLATTQKSSSSLQMTVLTYGSKKKDFKPGSKLSAACSALGVKPRYNCKKGDCNSCVLTVGGSRMKPCVGKVPPEPRLKSLQERGLEIR